MNSPNNNHIKIREFDRLHEVTLKIERRVDKIESTLDKDSVKKGWKVWAYRALPSIVVGSSGWIAFLADKA